MTTIDFALRCAEKMARTIPFFPNDELFFADIAEFMCTMCNSDDEIRWLLNASINAFPDWGKTGSIAALRALYCSRFTPADGVPASIDPPAALSRASRESLRIDQATDEFDRKLAQWKREKLLETGSSAGVFDEQRQIRAAAETIGMDRPAPQSQPAEKTPLQTVMDAVAGWRPKLPVPHVSPEEVRQVEAELATHPPRPTRSDEDNERLLRELTEALRSRGANP